MHTNLPRLDDRSSVFRPRENHRYRRAIKKLLGHRHGELRQVAAHYHSQTREKDREFLVEAFGLTTVNRALALHRHERLKCSRPRRQSHRAPCRSIGSRTKSTRKRGGSKPTSIGGDPDPVSPSRASLGGAL